MAPAEVAAEWGVLAADVARRKVEHARQNKRIAREFSSWIGGVMQSGGAKESRAVSAPQELHVSGEHANVPNATHSPWGLRLGTAVAVLILILTLLLTPATGFTVHFILYPIVWPGRIRRVISTAKRASF
mmetsp:Transcript_38250/g.88408  ORF Transcript_38250/g.88408 Transcript_38250/m.88408 type:complete len:130 (+) Transcript_38250:154-543(+)